MGCMGPPMIVPASTWYPGISGIIYYGPAARPARRLRMPPRRAPPYMPDRRYLAKLIGTRAPPVVWCAGYVPHPVGVIGPVAVLSIIMSPRRAMMGLPSLTAALWLVAAALATAPAAPVLSAKGGVTAADAASHTWSLDSLPPARARAPAAAARPIDWTETGAPNGIKWCSGGGDWDPPGAFGASKLGGCPAVPANWSHAPGGSPAACEQLCTPVAACLGFTLYPSEKEGGAEGHNLTTCCFRTGSVANKPACGGDPSCKATRCFQKFPDAPPPPPPPSPNITLAVGRRPYVFETTGHVLVRSAATDQRGRCAVSASLVGSGAVLSNGSWAFELGAINAVFSFAFSLEPLPPSVLDELNVTVACASVGWRTRRYRAFQRAPAAAAPARSVSQVDHLTRTMRVEGEAFLAVGWYYSIDDNGENNLTEFVAAQAQAGVNTLLLYTFPYLMLHGEAAMQRRVLDACDAVGMKVLMDVQSFVQTVGAAGNMTQDAMFKTVVDSVKDHPATLGYYVCDDCWGHDPAVQARFYRVLKTLDPYHITAGAGGASVEFSDGEQPGGWLQLSLDVPLIENYNKDLSSRSSPSAVENTARDYPMFWAPFVNCPWSESSNQMGTSSPGR